MSSRRSERTPERDPVRSVMTLTWRLREGRYEAILPSMTSCFYLSHIRWAALPDEAFLIVTSNDSQVGQVCAIPLTLGPQTSLGMFPRHLLAFGRVDLVVKASSQPSAVLEAYASPVWNPSPALVRVEGVVIYFKDGHAKVLAGDAVVDLDPMVRPT